MVQLNPTQLRGFIRKRTSNSQIRTVVCECLLNVVNGNVPVSKNLNKFERCSKFKSIQKRVLKKNELLY